MKRALLSKVIATAAFVAGAFGLAAAAQAQPGVRVVVDLPGRPAFFQPPVVVQAQPVFERGDRHDGPPSVTYEPAWRSPFRADREHAEWERHEWQRREWQRHHGRSPWDGRAWD